MRIERWDIEYPVESLLGLSFRYGGFPASRNFTDAADAEEAGLPNGLFDVANGMKVVDPKHPIFKETGLQKNEFFGHKSNLLFHEIDGVPLSPNDNSRDLNRKSWLGVFREVEQSFPKSIRILASAWILSPKPEEFRYVGTVVASDIGLGRVVHFGSVGWYKYLDSQDKVAKSIFLNSVDWQLNGS